MKPKRSKPVQTEFQQFLVLLRHFLLRLFNNDILKFEDQRRESLIIMLTFFMAGGGVIAAFILMPYLLAVLGFTSETAWIEKNLFMTLSMAFTGIISVINWNNMFLDEKDYLYLSGLPVKTNTLFTAKFFSLLAFVGIISVAFHFFPIFIFTFFLGEMYNVNPFYHTSIFQFGAVHLFSSFMANLFVFMLVALIQGILMLLLDSKRFKKVSMVVQPLLIMGFVSILIWFPQMVSTIEKLKEKYASFIYYFPPMWFVGFYEQMIGNYDIMFKKLFYIAPTAVTVLVDLYILSIPLCFKRFSRPSSAGKVNGKFSEALGSLKKSLEAKFLENPIRKAIFYFSLSTLNRSRKHKLQLAIYIALPLTFIVTELIILLSRNGWIYFNTFHPFLTAIPLLLYIFIIVGFRVVVLHPITEEANWVFRITEQKNPTHCMKGLKKAFFLIGILPVFILVFFFYLYCWGVVPAVFHSLFSAATAWLFLEIFFINYEKMPFVSTYVPGKANIKYFWALYLVGFVAYTWAFSSLGLFLMQNPLYYIIYYILVADVLYLIKRYQARRNRTFSFVFDEDPEPAMLSLGFDL
jgi:hypothetical protein